MKLLNASTFIPREGTSHLAVNHRGFVGVVEYLNGKWRLVYALNGDKHYAGDPGPLDSFLIISLEDPCSN